MWADGGLSTVSPLCFHVCKFVCIVHAPYKRTGTLLYKHCSTDLLVVDKSTFNSLFRLRNIMCFPNWWRKWHLLRVHRISASPSYFSVYLPRHTNSWRGLINIYFIYSSFLPVSAPSVCRDCYTNVKINKISELWSSIIAISNFSQTYELCSAKSIFEFI